VKIPRVSLEQWLAFKTIVEQGSYARAAEILNKSQSSMSYTINRLNQQLPQPVLVLDGRKAVMTEAGEILYRYAEQLLRQANEAEEVAASLALGFESEVSLAVDVLLEIDALICAFEDFSQQFPHTRIRVLETSLSGTSEALLERQADLVIGAVTPVGFSSTPLTRIVMLPVAAADHALVKGRDEVSELELRGFRQVVLRDTGARREQDAGWLQSEQRWTVSHFATSIKLVRSGLAFAFLPRNWIERELESGELQPIPLQQSLQRMIQLYLMLAESHTAGPATRALAELILARIDA